MTVFRPSLPPAISSTTRMVSLPGSIAWAVLAKNCGTAAPNARSDERARNSRRLIMGHPPFPYAASGQLIFRHAHYGVHRLANAIVQRLVLRLAFRDESDKPGFCSQI